MLWVIGQRRWCKENPTSKCNDTNWTQRIDNIGKWPLRKMEDTVDRKTFTVKKFSSVPMEAKIKHAKIFRRLTISARFYAYTLLGGRKLNARKFKTRNFSKRKFYDLRYCHCNVFS